MVEAAVVGQRDATYGEQVVAFVVPRETQPPRADLVEALLAHCRTRLARFKVPAHLGVIDQMPKNAIGKISKQELREVDF
ncbi:hypothetical protein ACFSOZ_25025 [Mesorhizobium newzealandense]|uniref:AMP-binding enzyme C-terminal domain-containing protein n=1 Tax=Mesorhizobium newzealandense TaxID=1300302 RepID=A0ABW4UHZ6_9HYPH